RAEARPAEHRLGDDRAADKRPELEAEDRDDGDERVSERVLRDDAGSGEALRARRAHVVLAELADHLVADDARVVRGAEDAERDRGQDERREVLAERLAVAVEREPP